MSAVLEAPQQQDSQSFQVDAVIAKYLEIRDQVSQIEGAAKAQTDSLKAQLVTIERWLHQKMQEVGTDQFKAKGVGTAFVKESDFCSVADWNAVLDFVKEHDAWHLLTKGVSKTAVKEFIDSSDGIPPPGVNYGMKQEVMIRRGK